jgi:hypothetical protein
MPKRVVIVWMGWAILISLMLALAFNATTFLNLRASCLLLAFGGFVGAGISTFLQKRRVSRRRQNANLLPLPPAIECREVASPGTVTRFLHFLPNATTIGQKCLNSLAWRQLGPSITSRPLLPQSKPPLFLP